ncbi:MAG: hypothetical protein AVDCRST_MAG70-258 [uncultured Thermomicrobiales bacterium]|uniref:Uncharacterized protein n=1 Tax=uncultured Thermomicrobiales bacterium TaxID=1645740 RepID=A0A6J4U7W8_9BACT|nr:MAG: hypothetical protein AVDCRST_MAG70-258 [uncultured Thermomicrobiales bacterium]
MLPCTQIPSPYDAARRRGIGVRSSFSSGRYDETRRGIGHVPREVAAPDVRWGQCDDGTGR